MPDTIDDFIAECRNVGPQQFSQWNRDAFDQYINGPVANLRHSLTYFDKPEIDQTCVRNVVRMICEGVGVGRLTPYHEPEDETDSPPHTSFLAHCVWNLLPLKLGRIPREQRSETLIRIWNIAEGLSREPAWLSQFVISQTAWSTDLTKLDAHLQQILTPILTPTSAARWDRLTGLQILNLRDEQDDFLPGRISLAAPSILSIEDRSRPGLNLAVWLKRQGKSEILGLVSQLPEYQESFKPPTVETTDNQVTVNGLSISTPFLMTPYQILCVASGFVVISSEDSQRLWLVEAS